MTETTMPTDLFYGKIIGRFILALSDGRDADRLPDAKPAQGKISISSVNPIVKALTPDPTTVIRSTYVFNIDPDGWLVDDLGNRGVWLITGSYKVAYNLKGVSLPPHTIEVTSEHTDATPLDLYFEFSSTGTYPSKSEYALLNERINNEIVPAVEAAAAPILAVAQSAKADAAQSAISAAAAIALGQEAQAAAYAIPDEANEAMIDNPATLTRGALDRHTAQAQSGLPFASGENFTADAGGGYSILETVGGIVHAAKGATIYTAPSVDGPFTLARTFSGNGSITVIRDAGDGELILARGGIIYRTNGWATGRATATLAQVLITGDGTTTNLVTEFGVDTDPASGWCVVTNYAQGLDMSTSRYLWLSKDRGVTWSVIHDMTTAYPSVDPLYSHCHVAALDTYHSATTPRIWHTFHKTDGDPTNIATPFKRIIYSDDAGATWATLSADEIQPVVGVATPRGMLFDVDGTPNALYVAERTSNPASMKLEKVWEQREAVAMPGWAAKAVRGAGGSVHIAFRSVTADVPAILVTTDGWRFTQTVTIPNATPADTVDVTSLTLDSKGRMMAVAYQTSSAPGVVKNPVWDEPRRGGITPLDTRGDGGGRAQSLGISNGPGSMAGIRGNARGVKAAAGEMGVAEGYGASALKEGVAVGNASTAIEEGVAVGSLASASGAQSTAVGRISTASGQYAVAIGRSAVAIAESIALGGLAKASGAQSTAVGALAVASGIHAIAVGRTANASGDGAIAIGRAAAASYGSSISLGASTATTATNQIAVGSRHFEMKTTSAPAAPAAGAVRLGVRNAADGQMEVFIRWPSGNITVVGSDRGVISTPGSPMTARPNAATVGEGAMFFDLSLDKPLWSNGTAWVDATGTAV